MTSRRQITKATDIEIKLSWIRILKLFIIFSAVGSIVMFVGPGPYIETWKTIVLIVTVFFLFAWASEGAPGV